jgi:hypothetical protein
MTIVVTSSMYNSSRDQARGQRSCHTDHVARDTRLNIIYSYQISVDGEHYWLITTSSRPQSPNHLKKLMEQAHCDFSGRSSSRVHFLSSTAVASPYPIAALLSGYAGFIGTLGLTSRQTLLVDHFMRPVPTAGSALWRGRRVPGAPSAPSASEAPSEPLAVRPPNIVWHEFSGRRCALSSCGAVTLFQGS